MANINLIPQEVKKEQAKQQVVKSTTFVAIGLLVLVALISGFLLFRYYSTKNKIAKTKSSIDMLRNDIESLADFEIIARTLDQKFVTVRAVLASRAKYSMLMSEFRKRIPSSVSIDTFSTGKNDTINISGSGADYIAIAEFVNNLASLKYESVAKGYEALFSEVALNSVNLDAQTSRARFFVVVTLNQELLRK